MRKIKNWSPRRGVMIERLTCKPLVVPGNWMPYVITLPAEPGMMAWLKSLGFKEGKPPIFSKKKCGNFNAVQMPLVKWIEDDELLEMP